MTSQVVQSYQRELGRDGALYVVWMPGPWQHTFLAFCLRTYFSNCDTSLFGPVRGFHFNSFGIRFGLQSSRPTTLAAFSIVPLLGDEVEKNSVLYSYFCYWRRFAIVPWASWNMPWLTIYIGYSLYSTSSVLCTPFSALRTHASPTVFHSHAQRTCSRATPPQVTRRPSTADVW